MKSNKVFLLDEDEFDTHGAYTYWIITSSLSDHRLAYRINKALSFNLHRTEHDHHVTGKAAEFYHTTYQWRDNFREIDWFMIANRGTSQGNSNTLFADQLQNSIVPSSQKVDYILIAHEELSNSAKNTISDGLKSVSGILRVSDYEPSKSICETLRIELENYIHE